jgi:hypothetical protein
VARSVCAGGVGWLGSAVCVCGGMRTSQVEAYLGRSLSGLCHSAECPGLGIERALHVGRGIGWQIVMLSVAVSTLPAALVLVGLSLYSAGAP